MRHTHPPVVKTDRLMLRGFEPGDIGRLAEVLGDPLVMRYFPGGRPWTRERTERELVDLMEHWQRHGYGRWAVIDRENEKMIGWCGLGFLPELGETEIAYLLDRGYWNRGIATEAAKISLKFGFEEAKLNMIIALAFPENVASVRVMEKIGMAYDGVIHIWNSDLVRYKIIFDMFRRAYHA